MPFSEWVYTAINIVVLVLLPTALAALASAGCVATRYYRAAYTAMPPTSHRVEVKRDRKPRPIHPPVRGGDVMRDNGAGWN